MPSSGIAVQTDSRTDRRICRTSRECRRGPSRPLRPRPWPGCRRSASTRELAGELRPDARSHRRVPTVRPSMLACCGRRARAEGKRRAVLAVRRGRIAGRPARARRAAAWHPSAARSAAPGGSGNGCQPRCIGRCRRDLPVSVPHDAVVADRDRSSGGPLRTPAVRTTISVPSGEKAGPGRSARLAIASPTSGRRALVR